jgi:GAF domain-containing protein
LLEAVIEGRRVSGILLAIIVKLTGFDRGAVFVTRKRGQLKLAQSLGIKNERKAVESLVRRSAVSVSSPVEYIPDLTILKWFQTSHLLKGSLILSYACAAIVRGTKQFGVLYLDSTTQIRPIDKEVKSRLPRLARVMLEVLI